MYEERPPGSDLAGRIACVWHQVSETDTTHLVVPDACVDLIWGPDGLFVAGPDTGPVPTPMAAGDTFVGIRFKPGAVGDFFGVPLHELRDQRVPLSALPGLPIDESCAPQPGWRLEAMRAAVRRRLTGSGSVEPATFAMVQALRAGRAVTDVAWDLGLSERQLHRRSVTAFGYAPKTLQRIVRFQRALRLARAGVPLADVAAEAGYTDQAHLSRDVKRLSGVPMGRLLSPSRRPA
ncbi:helix-turn-helix transcriptional regulator [Nonomuraea sp. SYSU D8015]|uniref:helix-turn-helix transcriptional regulator n=1 Tax=Nonomuraea sp. SYSU D8015 TaxID=2593644 RepID=UPI00166148D0|nr:helix-turn-helix transcriptional regulator [Nonomuraea sp. SYSU D8015]